MAIVDRVKNILVSPNTEWRVIDAEPATAGSLIGGYAAPLMALSAVAGFIGGSIIGTSMMFVSGTYRVPIVAGLAMACYVIVGGLIGLFILSVVINALAPTFGGQQNSTQALKVAVYAYTPAWIAGLLNIIPMLGVLAIIGALYGMYLLYLGLPTVMKAPPDKAVGYTVVVLVCAIVLQLVVSMVGLAIVGVGAVGSGMMSGALGGASDAAPGADVQFDKDSPLGRLQELGKAMEQSNKQMEAAQKSGDPNATAAAAMSALGTLMGGGKKVDPLEIDQLRAFVPVSFAGLDRDGNGSAEKSGIGSLMVSKAGASYGAGDKRVRLEIVDSGGASGLMGLASWAAIQTTREDDSGSERTTKVNGRTVHEKDSKQGTDEYAVILGERFMVTASSSDVELAALRSAVSALDLSRLESMKDVGVQKP